MLLMFSCQNFRSFRAAATLDLRQRSFTTNRPKNDDWAGATHRVAAVYGPNASGKSNLLRSFDQLQSTVLWSIQDDSHLRALRDPHKLGRNEPTRFIVNYVAQNVRFQWEIVLNDEGIQEESLYASETSRWRMVFERNGNNVTFGRQSGLTKAAQENINEYAKSWALTLSAWKVVKSPGRYYPAVEWWRKSVGYVAPDVMRRAEHHAAALQLAQHEHWLELGVAALSYADVGISKLNIKEEEAPDHLRRFFTALQSAFDDISEDLDVESLSDDDARFIRQHLEFTHTSSENSFVLRESDESLGTIAWFDLLMRAVYALVTCQVLVVDEIDSSLHPVLVREIVQLFKNIDTNPSHAQLVFTTHDTTLLGNDLETAILPSEAWLIEKTDSYSELIAWDEYEIRSNHNVEKRYLQGAFGALPIPDRAPLQAKITTLRNEFLDFSEG